MGVTVRWVAEAERWVAVTEGWVAEAERPNLGKLTPRWALSSVAV